MRNIYPHISYLNYRLGPYTFKMSDFISVVNRISAIVQNNKHVYLESKNLRETITTIVECLEKEGLDLVRVEV